MNKRNTLRDTLNPFTEPSESDKTEKELSEYKHFLSIESYPGNEKPSLDEIKTVEKVLKYASSCNWMGFTKEDALLVFGVSTNILKWGLNYNEKSENG